MSEKNIKSRIVHKHDLESNWLLATNFTPKQGELIVYDVDENYDYERIKIGDGVQNVNALPFITETVDWNDLLNRPFGEVSEYYVDPCTVECTDIHYLYVDSAKSVIIGETYTVTFDGVEYECECLSYKRFGNLSLYYDTEEDTGEPFLLRYDGMVNGYVLTVKETGTHTISIEQRVVEHLDEKYIPETIARVADLPSLEGYATESYVDDKITEFVGDTTVAEQIESAITEFKDSEDNFSGSWNDLADKPFEETYEYTITSDGNKEGLLNAMSFYKVSDLVLSIEDFANGFTFKAAHDGVEQVYTKDDVSVGNMFWEGSTAIKFKEGPYFTVLQVDTASDGITLTKGVYFLSTTSIAHTLKVGKKNILDDACISDNIARVSDIEDAIAAIPSIGAAGTAEGAEIFNDYTNSVASGRYSHAEGNQTYALEAYAHAEGNGSMASGVASHAEGMGTEATGFTSHAEGNSTVASGANSHAEGFGTKASSGYQHVQGKHNVEDTESKYLHIVGNGDSNTARSNAHTVDWDGLGWFAGGVKVGGTGQDDADAKELATVEYVDGQVAVVNEAVSNVSALVGDTSVAEQIDNAIAEIPAETFVATYGTTTIDELLTAYKAGKTMFCEYKDAGIYAVLAQAVYESDTECGFTFTDALGRTIVGLTLTYGEDWTMQSLELASQDYVNEQIEASNIIYVGSDEPTDSNIKVWVNTSVEGTGVIPVLPRVTTITLAEASWVGNSAPYSQVVEINTVTAVSKVDLQPTVSQIVSMQNDDIALMAENIDGVVTIYSFGGKPTGDMTMQVLLQEVSFV